MIRKLKRSNIYWFGFAPKEKDQQKKILIEYFLKFIGKIIKLYIIVVDYGLWGHFIDPSSNISVREDIFLLRQ